MVSLLVMKSGVLLGRRVDMKGFIFKGKCWFLVLVFLLSFNFAAEAGRSKTDTDRANSFERYYGLLPDDALQKKVDAIGQRLIKANGLSVDDFTFKVVNSGEVNAVTLPGGYIYVFKGLIDFMPTEEELSAVIAHEMGHVMGNHIARREREQILTAILGAALGGPEAAIAANAALASMPAYGQRDEREADDSAFKYTVNAGINPYSVLIVMGKLGDISSAGRPSNFSQHPEPEVRLERVKKYVVRMGVLPEVLQQGQDDVLVRDNGWEFVVDRPDGSNKALYRAWLLAGSLYSINKEEVPVADKFIALEKKDRVDIYYGEHFIYSVGQNDVLAGNDSLPGKAALYIEQLRAWAQAKERQK